MRQNNMCNLMLWQFHSCHCIRFINAFSIINKLLSNTSAIFSNKQNSNFSFQYAHFLKLIVGNSIDKSKVNAHLLGGHSPMDNQRFSIRLSNEAVYYAYFSLVDAQTRKYPATAQVQLYRYPRE